MWGLRRLIFLCSMSAEINVLYSQGSQSFSCAILDVAKAWKGHRWQSEMLQFILWAFLSSISLPLTSQSPVQGEEGLRPAELTSLPTAWLLCYLHRTNTRMEKKRRLATSQCYSQVWFYIYHFISIRRKGGVQKTGYQSLSTSSTALATWANDPNGPRNCPSLQLSELLHYTLTRMHQTPTCLDVLLTWPPGQQQVSDAFTRAPIK